MADKKISQLTANTNPSGGEELVYAYNNANGKMSLNTLKTFVGGGKQDTLVSGVNIKTINHKSILGSGNINIEGGGGGGGEEIIELEYDANIWELDDGIYSTTWELFYKSGEALPYSSIEGAVQRWIIRVTQNGSGVKGFTGYSVLTLSSQNIERAYSGFGYSKSSSEGEYYRLNDWARALKEYEIVAGQTDLKPLGDVGVTQFIEDVEGSQTLRITGSNKVYSGLTYTVIVSSVASGEDYSISVSTGVTNPFNITLPTSSNKPCIITLVATSDTTAIVTSCTIKS